MGAFAAAFRIYPIAFCWSGTGSVFVFKKTVLKPLLAAVKTPFLKFSLDSYPGSPTLIPVSNHPADTCKLFIATVWSALKSFIFYAIFSIIPSFIAISTLFK